MKTHSNFSSSKNDTNIEDKEDLLNDKTSEINVDDSEEESSTSDLRLNISHSKTDPIFKKITRMHILHSGEIKYGPFVIFNI